MNANVFRFAIKRKEPEIGKKHLCSIAPICGYVLDKTLDFTVVFLNFMAERTLSFRTFCFSRRGIR